MEPDGDEDLSPWRFYIVVAGGEVLDFVFGFDDTVSEMLRNGNKTAWTVVLYEVQESIREAT